MLDLMQLIQEADLALLDVERARTEMEAAKVALEMAKSEHERVKIHFDSVIVKADELGVPRAKLKKLVEERTAALSASGLLSTPANKSAVKESKSPNKKSSKTKTKKEDENLMVEDPSLKFDSDDQDTNSQSLDA